MRTKDLSRDQQSHKKLGHALKKREVSFDLGKWNEEIQLLLLSPLSRVFLVRPALNHPVITSTVTQPPVKMAARAVRYVTSIKQDSTAPVLRASRDTDVNSHSDHSKKPWWPTKKILMVSTTFWTSTTVHSQPTATSVPSPLMYGPWYSHTLLKTLPRSRAKPSTCTTCQSTRMLLNRTGTDCQCHEWGTLRIPPLIGEPLATSRLTAWISKIMSALRWI